MSSDMRDELGMNPVDFLLKALGIPTDVFRGDGPDAQMIPNKDSPHPLECGCHCENCCKCGQVTYYRWDRDTDSIEPVLSAEAFGEMLNDNKQLEHTELKGGVRISTIFLVRDHLAAYGIPSPYPILWETIVFGGPLNGMCYRYSDLQDAREGHEKMVQQCEGMLPMFHSMPDEEIPDHVPL